MKTKLLTAFCVVALVLSNVHTARGEDELEAVADVVVARPAGLVATAIGSAIFIVALPFAAMSRSVKKTGDVLVGKPARFTFTRPVGDFSNWSN